MGVAQPAKHAPGVALADSLSRHPRDIAAGANGKARLHDGPHGDIASLEIAPEGGLLGQLGGFGEALAQRRACLTVGRSPGRRVAVAGGLPFAVPLVPVAEVQEQRRALVTRAGPGRGEESFEDLAPVAASAALRL